MALGNSILVFPRFQKDKIKYRQLSIVTASVAIALSFTTIILMIFAFGGPMRLFERLINPAPQAITLQIFSVYFISLFIHFLILVQLLPHKFDLSKLLSFSLTLAVFWSILIMASVLLFRKTNTEASITLIVSWYLFFYSLLFAGGQLILFTVCAICDKLFVVKCNKSSISTIKKQIAAFSFLFILSGAFYYLKS